MHMNLSLVFIAYFNSNEVIEVICYITSIRSYI